MRAQEFVAERTDPRLEIENMSTILPGDLNEYFVRFTDQDKIGFSAHQHFGRTPDVDDPRFDPLALPRPQGRPALWFYPLQTYLRHQDLYAGNMPYTWLVRIKPGAWLQPVDGKTSKQDAPPGKKRVGMLRREQVIDMAVFFQPAFSVVDRWHTPSTKQKQKFTEYKINNQSGIGSVPKNQEIDYFGLRVAMRPSTFLKLALPMPNTAQDQESIEYVKQHKDTEGIGAPFLEIDIPQGWEEGNLSKPARVVGHDGRHRMAAILQSEGDDPVEVHLFPLGLRRRHFDANPEWAQHLNQVIVGQRGNTVPGPIFK